MLARAVISMGLPEHDCGRPRQEAPTKVNHTNTPRVPDFEQMARRSIVESIRDASRIWWLKRAEDFERAKPRPGDDFNGAATIEELRARWQWCHDTAQACRNKAALVPLDDAQFRAELDAILDEGPA